ncbi:MAG: hypothetical protein PVH69_10415, partial [Desulfobacterales bacterium]
MKLDDSSQMTAVRRQMLSIVDFGIQIKGINPILSDLIPALTHRKPNAENRKPHTPNFRHALCPMP